MNAFIVLLQAVLLSVVLATAAPGDLYVPAEDFLINCGSSGADTDLDNRQWSGDDDMKVAQNYLANTLVGLAGQTMVPAVPYLSARIFPKHFTYSFPLSMGRKFLRLYFNPSNYTGDGDAFTTSNALFDVTAGEYTLLKNFSAYDTASALNYDSVQLEYSLNVTSSGFLNLTFTPSSNLSDSYAFVNGIEIVSIPDIFSNQPSLLGANVEYTIDPTVAVQTVIRLNVGGNFISPNNNSGLYRTWYDDSGYIYGAGLGVSYGKDPNVTVNYTSADPTYIAPADVYGTARSMGPSVSVNRNYNLTWMIPVDAGFYYLVRLHFCEIQYPMTKANMRVFDVFINNQTATQRMDIISRTGGIGSPVYLDHVLVVPDGPPQDLWIALHPNEAFKPMYVDAILNGLEVFKLNTSDGNLAGPNPAPRPKPTGTDGGVNGSFTNGEENNTAAVLGGAVGGAATTFLLLCAVLFFVRRRSRSRSSTTSTDPFLNSKSRGLPTISYTGSKTSTSLCTDSTMASTLCRHFSFADIEAATNRFDEKLLLGVGGFGKVYRGSIADESKTIMVAIKRANPSSDQGIHEFRNEIEMLSQLRHRHLVSLIGSCEENGEMILIYDYMANGTLREHLYQSAKNKPLLSWTKRLEICIGAARGLHYLHTGAKHSIIHRDVKTTNILLDEKWVAKVSDFGLSKAGPAMDATHVSTFVKGSFGYMDPEYFKRQQLTEKSDVYSFGVVLLEVLCGRPALLPQNPRLSREEINLAEWARHCKKKGVLEDIVDENLKAKIDPKCFNKYVEVAEKCLAEHGLDRPTMGDVLWTLESSLQLQHKSGSVDVDDDSIGGATTGKQKKDVDDDYTSQLDSKSPPGVSTTVAGASTATASTSTVSVDSQVELTPSVVFSEIIGTERR